MIHKTLLACVLITALVILAAVAQMVMIGCQERATYQRIQHNALILKDQV